jgi:phosphatidylglycerophosphate synthase
MSGKVNGRDVNRAVNWACYTVTINLALLVAGVLLAKPFPAIFILVVAGVGLVTFFGVLMAANFLSEKLDLNKGEMRKALAASLTISFLTLMAILAFAGKASPPTDLSNTLIETFKWIIITIIAFYFGTRTVKEAREALNKTSGKK